MDEFDDPFGRIFAQHVDTAYRTLDLLQDALHASVEVLTEALLTERRILACGIGPAAALAQVFASTLLCHSRVHRPALPVISIGADAGGNAWVSTEFGADGVLARQVQALGQAGDVLLVIAATDGGAALQQALDAAQRREMSVLLLRAGESGVQAPQLGPRGIDLPVPDHDTARVLECQLIALNALAALLEARLFGDAG